MFHGLNAINYYSRRRKGDLFIYMGEKVCGETFFPRVYLEYMGGGAVGEKQQKFKHRRRRRRRRKVLLIYDQIYFIIYTREEKV